MSAPPATSRSALASAGNALIGADKSFALNPFSVEGNVGASLALGAAGLTLRYVP